jgi:hypothetical protein
MGRQTERDAIDAFLDARGVTRCPDRFAAAVAGALPMSEERVRLASVTPPSLTRKEIKRFLYMAYGPQSRR